jgi:hypothetical protein
MVVCIDVYVIGITPQAICGPPPQRDIFPANDVMHASILCQDRRRQKCCVFSYRVRGDTGMRKANSYVMRPATEVCHRPFKARQSINCTSLRTILQTLEHISHSTQPYSSLNSDRITMSDQNQQQQKGTLAKLADFSSKFLY